MEHDSIIISLCRIGLGNGGAAFSKQVERLRDSLTKSGKTELATRLNELLDKTARDIEMRPSKLTLSKAAKQFERLTPTVSAPADRETGTSLAEIIFPEQPELAYPILNTATAAAVESIVDEWVHSDRLAAMGEHPPFTCLLYGMPGTGKTSIAKTIAARMNLPLVVARLDGLISSFLGTTARNIGTLFQFANRYNTILLLDEFDAIAKLRNDPQEVGEIKRVVNALIQNLDARQNRGMTIAITNHEDLLDPAIWRRFQVRIKVPAPDTSIRDQIARLYFNSPDLSDTYFRFIAWITEGMTGADMETMARSVKRYKAINPSKSALDAFKAFATTHAGGTESTLNALSTLDDESLVTKLTHDSRTQFTQLELAEIFNCNQATISRWKNKEKLNS